MEDIVDQAGFGVRLTAIFGGVATLALFVSGLLFANMAVLGFFRCL